MAQSKNPHLSVNPLVDAIIKAGGPGSVIRCSGYVGASGLTGEVRLYLTLNDLSQYIQFEEGAIVRTFEAGGRIFVWLKANAKVRAVHARTMEARALAGVVARNRRFKRWLLVRRNQARATGANQ
jgi:hypothetical protein